MDISKLSIDEYIDIAINANWWRSKEYQDRTTIEKEVEKLNIISAFFRAVNRTGKERLPLPEYLKMENRIEVATLVTDAINDICEPDYS